MSCTEICLDIATGALRCLGNFVEKRCFTRGRGCVTLKQQQQQEGNYFSDGGEVQYNAIINPKFSEGTRGWYGEGCSLFVGTTDDASSCYCVAQGRGEKHHGLAQEIGKRLDAGVSYRVQAWVGIRCSGSGQAAEQEAAVVHATLKVLKASDVCSEEQRILLSSVEVQKGQWCLLTGTLQGSDPEPGVATIYIDGPDGEFDILVSSVAVVPTPTTGARIVEIHNQIDHDQVLGSKMPKEVAFGSRPALKAASRQIMAKWSGSVSGTVAVSVERVWGIARFGELDKWDPNTIESCVLEQGDGCSAGSVRSVVFKYSSASSAGGSNYDHANTHANSGSLIERMTYYDADDYTYCFEMDDNTLGIEGYSCTFRLEDHGDGTTTVNYSFEMDPMEGSSEQTVIGGLERTFWRRISLLEVVAADNNR